MDDDIDNLVDQLLKNCTVYYINCTISNNKIRILYSVAGCFVKKYTNFYFYPFPPNQVQKYILKFLMKTTILKLCFMIQTKTYNGVPLKKVKKLPSGRYNVVYYSKEDVIEKKEICLLPKGVVINK